MTGVERGPLLAAVSFMEGVVAGWSCWELSDWFEQHLVRTGRCARAPSVVHDPAVGSIVIDPRWSDLQRTGIVGVEQLPALLRAARQRVADTLTRFLPPESDDAFVAAATEAKRVERRQVRDQLRWVPCPNESDALSDVVLSLFAADMLENRAFYDAQLSVCEVCGRVSFDPVATRTLCGEHRDEG
jgi:hypothetical protein